MRGFSSVGVVFISSLALLHSCSSGDKGSSDGSTAGASGFGEAGLAGVLDQKGEAGSDEPSAAGAAGQAEASGGRPELPDSCKSHKTCIPFDLLCDKARGVCVECVTALDCASDEDCVADAKTAHCEPAKAGEGGSGQSGAAGAPSAGGALARGGAYAQAGQVGLGGAGDEGGTSAAGGTNPQGGVPAMGGANGKGGAQAGAGGAIQGGASSEGGAIVEAGGNEAGGATNGGAVNQGGTVAGGGILEQGGALGEGGAPSEGGVLSEGGTPNVGGIPGQGGTPSEGGSLGDGGTPASGGQGGAAGAENLEGNTAIQQGGCSESFVDCDETGIGVAIHFLVNNVSALNISMQGAAAHYYLISEFSQAPEIIIDSALINSGAAVPEDLIMATILQVSDTQWRVAFNFSNLTLGAYQFLRIDARVVDTVNSVTDRTNDYSYSTKPNFTNSPTMTMQVGTDLIWGQPPAW